MLVQQQSDASGGGGGGGGSAAEDLELDELINGALSDFDDSVTTAELQSLYQQQGSFVPNRDKDTTALLGESIELQSMSPPLPDSEPLGSPLMLTRELKGKSKSQYNHYVDFDCSQPFGLALKEGHGCVMVTEVTSGSQAEISGVKVGMWLVAIDGKYSPSIATLTEAKGKRPHLGLDFEAAAINGDDSDDWTLQPIPDGNVVAPTQPSYGPYHQPPAEREPAGPPRRPTADDPHFLIRTRQGPWGNSPKARARPLRVSRLRPVLDNYPGRKLREILESDSGNYRRSWFARGGIFGVSTSDHLNVWDIQSGKQIAHVGYNNRSAGIGAKGVATASSPTADPATAKERFCVGDTKGHLQMYLVPAIDPDQSLQQIQPEWDLDLNTLEEVLSVAFSGTGNLIACISKSGIIVVVDVRLQESIARLEMGTTVDVWRCQLQFTTKYLLAGCSDSVAARLWKVSDDSHFSHFRNLEVKEVGAGHARTYRCIALCPMSETHVAGGTEEGDVVIFDIESGEDELLVLPPSSNMLEQTTGTSRCIMSLAYTNLCDGSDLDYCSRIRLAVAQRSGRVSVHDMRSMACIACFDESDAKNAGFALCFDPANIILATGGGDCRILLRELQPGTASSYLGMGNSRVQHIKGEIESNSSKEPGGMNARPSHKLLKAKEGWGMYSHDTVHDMEAATELFKGSEPIVSVCANEHYVVLGGGRRLMAFERHTGKSTECTDGAALQVADFLKQPGKRFSAARPMHSEMAYHVRSNPSKVFVLTLPDLKLRDRIDFQNSCDGVAYSADGSALLAWGRFGAILYDASALTRGPTISVVAGATVYGACVSPNAKLVATTGKYDQQTGVAVWELDLSSQHQGAKKPPLRFFPENSPKFRIMNWICFDSDGRRLAYTFPNTEHHEEHIKIVDVTVPATEAVLLEYGPPHGGLRVQSFSPDGNWLLCRGATEIKGQIVLIDTNAQQRVEGFHLFSRLFLEQAAATDFTIGWMTSCSSGNSNGPGDSGRGAPIIHVAAAEYLHVFDLQRAIWMFEDGVLEASQLRGAAADVGKSDIISRTVARFPHAPNMQNHIDGETVLHQYARELTQVETLRQWLSAGTFIPIPNKCGRTALGEAIKAANRKAVIMLISQITQITTARMAELLGTELRSLAQSMPDLIPWAFNELEPKVMRQVNEGYAYCEKIDEKAVVQGAFNRVGFPGRKGDVVAKDTTDAAADEWLSEPESWFTVLKPPPGNDVDHDGLDDGIIFSDKAQRFHEASDESTSKSTRHTSESTRVYELVDATIKHLPLCLGAPLEFVLWILWIAFSILETCIVKRSVPRQVLSFFFVTRTGRRLDGVIPWILCMICVLVCYVTYHMLLVLVYILCSRTKATDRWFAIKDTPVQICDKTLVYLGVHCWQSYPCSSRSLSSSSPFSIKAKRFRNTHDEVLVSHQVMMLSGLTEMGKSSMFRKLYKHSGANLELYDTRIMQAAIKYKWNTYVETADRVERHTKLAKLSVSIVAVVATTAARLCRGHCAEHMSYSLQEEPFEIITVTSRSILHLPLIFSLTIVDLLLGFMALLQVHTIKEEILEAYNLKFSR
eukprot:COSAG05_NODE_1241_length_5419_cov_3.965789_2_plen_1576_part_00